MTREYAAEYEALINQFKAQVKLKQDEKDKLDKILQIKKLECHQLADRIDELTIDNQTKQGRIEQLEKQLEDIKSEPEELIIGNQTKQRMIKLPKKQREDIKSEPDDRALIVRKLEKMHKENVKKVLKDAQNIKPYYSDSNWICDVIDKVSVDNI